jgi:hypothetical protein
MTKEMENIWYFGEETTSWKMKTWKMEKGSGK